jgi:hypothetical protein
VSGGIRRRKIVLMLRDKREGTADNGIWLATTAEHHQSLRREFRNMRSIQIFGKKVTGWQVLPVDARIGVITKRAERFWSGAKTERQAARAFS